ncbi:MAG: hypothetical protein CVV05_12125 [Gammaproteobacteria bacterium HGW-Gammaproteobacteria-1]|nr:MAG: hypothetical protein CVV05_12125 [Gammaproteobacteria bacterium HGW-Gammaproteobacteria-1]
MHMTAIIPPRALDRDRAPNRIGQLVIIFVLILIFIVTAARRIWELRIVAEQTSVMHTVGALHSAIGIQVMERVLRGGLEGVAAMEHANPMDYLDPERMPGNYQQLDGPVPAEQLTPRRWYFEPQQGILIYRVDNGDYLETELPGPPRIRFQLQLRYDDANGNGHYDAGIDSLGGVGMVALEPYRWLAP